MIESRETQHLREFLKMCPALTQLEVKLKRDVCIQWALSLSPPACKAARASSLTIRPYGPC